MSIKIYENGSWKDCTGLKRYSGGAWVDCTFVKKYSNGSWVEVWSAGKKLSLYTTNLNPSATYNLSKSSDNKSLTYSLTGAGDTSNNILYIVKNDSGFGTSVKIQYTLKQNLNTALAGLYWLGGDMATKLISHYESIPTATTYTKTVTTNNPTVLYLLIDAWKTYSISGTISDIYINDELITFE